MSLERRKTCASVRQHAVSDCDERRHSSRGTS